MGFSATRFTLPNGLRIVLAPDSSAPVAGVGVAVDAGFRTDPQGRSGLAHLFEHLMFQGSPRMDKLAYARHVLDGGGSFGAATYLDFTYYQQICPSNALERALFLEADRLCGIRLTEANLRNQIDVVKQEIRVHVLDRPYGGFPWLRLSPLMFETFPNRHNGYGCASELEATTIAEAEDFFRRHYATGNTTVAVAGDFELDSAIALVHRHLGEVPGRPAPPPVCANEAEPTVDRYARYVDPRAPLPAMAVAWRVPDPISDLTAYVPYLAVAEALTGQHSPRLFDRLVLGEKVATSVGASLGFIGEPFEVRGPTVLLVQAHLAAGGRVQRPLDVIVDELDRLAQQDITDNEVSSIRATLRMRLLRGIDRLPDRVRALVVFELQRGRYGGASILTELPDLIADLTAASIADAAKALVSSHRACVELVPGLGVG